MNNMDVCSFKQCDLKKALQKVLPFVNKEEYRAPNLTGVLLNIDGNTITVVGCDAYRLSQVTIPCELNSNTEKLLLNGKGATCLFNVLSNDRFEKDVLMFHDTPFEVRFQFEGFCIIVDLLTKVVPTYEDGVLHEKVKEVVQYLNYKKMMPVQHPVARFNINSEKLKKAPLKKEVTPIKMKVVENNYDTNLELHLKDKRYTIDDLCYTLCDPSSEPHEIMINPQFLLESVKHLKNEELIIKIFSGYQGLTIESTNTLTWLLPLKE